MFLLLTCFEENVFYCGEDGCVERFRTMKRWYGIESRVLQQVHSDPLRQESLIVLPWRTCFHQGICCVTLLGETWTFMYPYMKHWWYTKDRILFKPSLVTWELSGLLTGAWVITRQLHHGKHQPNMHEDSCRLVPWSCLYSLTAVGLVRVTSSQQSIFWVSVWIVSPSKLCVCLAFQAL